MAAANIVRSAFNGLLRKSTNYRTPVVCRLATVALKQKYHTVKAAVNLPYKQYPQNGVLSLRVQGYSDQAKPSLQQIQERVLKACQSFSKLTTAQLTVDSHFMTDLGLDSLDHVEVIMAMEDEFGFEIPDSDADRLVRPRDIIQYVADKQDIFE